MSKEQERPELNEISVDIIAKICHQANKALCESQADFSQVDWDKAPQWQVDSARNGVRFVINNQHAPDSANHDSWMVEKVKDGWVYGEVKDAEKKTHPCMVPFEQLPIEQQLKDKLFRAVVMSFAGVMFEEQVHEFELNSIKLSDGPMEDGKDEIDEISKKRLEGFFAKDNTPIKIEPIEGRILGSWAWAWDQLQNGLAVRLPSWKGYWRWYNEGETIIMHCKDGSHLDIRNMEQVHYTMDNLASNDWRIAEDAETVELNVTFMPFQEAFRAMLKGDAMKRVDSDDYLAVFVRPSDTIEGDTIDKVKSVPHIAKLVGVTKAEALQFGKQLMAVASNGSIVGFTPTDADLFAKDWVRVEPTYKDLIQYNNIIGK